MANNSEIIQFSDYQKRDGVARTNNNFPINLKSTTLLELYNEIMSDPKYIDQHHSSEFKSKLAKNLIFELAELLNT